jgi:hypothetical protein
MQIPKDPKYIATLIFFVSFFTPIGEVHFFWEKLPVFNVLFGFFGCIVLIFFSKWLGKLILQRDEKYYE